MSERPLPGYAGLTAAFATVLAGFLATSRERLPERPPATDVVRIGLASYKLGRLVTKDEITSFLRAPVTEDPEATRPKQSGVAGALGKLLTCPYCVGMWTAAGLSYAHVLAPREARFVTGIFGADAIADFLNAGFVRLREGSSQAVREGAEP
jgi:Protein of unknown function (DUF1360)